MTGSVVGRAGPASRARIGRLAHRARLALLPAGLAFALGAEAVRLAAGWPLDWVIPDLLPGLAFLVAGLVAWQRRPDNRIGPLMVATGFAWYIGTYGASTDPLVGRAASGFQGWYDGLLAWLVLAYPSGHLRSRAARIAVGGFFAVLAVRSAVRLATFRLSTDYDLSDPAAVDRFIADRTFRESADAVFRFGIAAIAIVVLILVVSRLRSESALGRRVAGPILIGGIAIAVGIAIETGVIASAGSFQERAAAWDLGQLLTVGTASLVPIGFVVGLARERLARGSVADLVVELGEAPSPPALRDVLARSLRDPSLAIAYAVPGTDRFVDVAGQPMELPRTDSADRAVTRLEAGGRTIAALIHDPALAEQQGLVTSVAAAARLALDNERLAAEVRTQLEEVRRSRARIVVAGDAERRRVERDLHDGAQQRLVTLALTLQMARADVDDTNPAIAATLARAGHELDLALAELRDLARGLHPTVLAEEGLASAVEALADRTPVRVSVYVPARRFRPQVETAAYYVVAEALTNVVKYARSGSVMVRIQEVRDMLVVDVIDDGIGGADPAGGSGLRGLDDRVAAAGGRLAIRSERGAGTTVHAEIPCG